MDVLIKAVICGFIAVILSNMMPADRKEYSLLVGVAACCIIGISAVSYMQPVLDLMNRLTALGNLNTQMITIMVKVVGVGVLLEISTLVCEELGNGALGKMIHLLGVAAIFWMTIPLFDEFTELIESVLERI